MSDWTIGLMPPPPAGRGLWIVDAPSAQQAWRMLTKPARAAIEAAYPNKSVHAHKLTIKALERHGFVVGVSYSNRIGHLTDAGKACAKWNVKP